jgi:hypothetical protein
MNIVDGKKTQVKTQKCINFGENWISSWVSCFCTFKVLWKKPFSMLVMWPRLKWMRKEIGKCGEKSLSGEKSCYNFGNNTLLNSEWQNLRWATTTNMWFCEKHFSILCDKSWSEQGQYSCEFVKTTILNYMWQNLRWMKTIVNVVLWEEHFSSCDKSWSNQEAWRKHVNFWSEWKGHESMTILKPPFWKHGHN